MSELCVFQNLALVGRRTMAVVTTCPFRHIDVSNDIVSCGHAERTGRICPSPTIGRAQRNDDHDETVASRDFRATTGGREIGIRTD